MKYPKAAVAACQALKDRLGARLIGLGLGISTQAVNKWEVVPTRRLKDIKRLYGDDPHTLRPDVIPAP